MTICPACGGYNDVGRSQCEACGAALKPAPGLSAGAVVAGRYEIQQTLGRGGMGMVYRAHDRLLNQVVAIKVLRPDLEETPEMGQRFLAEVKLARAVSHKNVCRIHEYGEDGGLRYICMAFVDGVDLKRLRSEGGPLPPEEAFRVVIAIAEGLHAVHEEGIVHRDLKTANVMIDRKGGVRLMDFGIARQAAGSASGVTATGSFVGTPDYISPEQARGEKGDFRSDIYALGIVLYELFAGDVPFRADTPIATLMKHLNDAPPLDGPRATKIPAPLIPVLARALAKSPSERYQTMEEMIEALREARALSLNLSGAAPVRTFANSAVPVDEPPTSTQSRPTPIPPRTEPTGVTTRVVAAIVLLLGLAAAFAWRSRPHSALSTGASDVGEKEGGVVSSTLAAAPNLVDTKAKSDPLAIGQRLVENGDFEEAIRPLSDAIDAMAGDWKASKDLATAYLYRGIAYFALHRPAEAKRDVARAGRLNPGLRIDPKEFPPRLAAHLEVMLEAAQHERRQQERAR